MKIVINLELDVPSTTNVAELDIIQSAIDNLRAAVSPLGPVTDGTLRIVGGETPRDMLAKAAPRIARVGRGKYKVTLPKGPARHRCSGCNRPGHNWRSCPRKGKR